MQKTAPNSSIVKFQLVLSDGIDTIKGMAMTQLNHLFLSGDLVENSVVSLTNYTLNSTGSE
jgi:hypothetical protein